MTCSDTPVTGGSWEGFVIENILSVAPAGSHPFYYRTTHGAEIDLVLEFSGREKWAIEIKRSTAPAISKGFYLACAMDIAPNKRFVVYAGQDKFPMRENIIAISLSGMMEELLKYRAM